MSLDICTCSTCGYQWVRGKNGEHSCTERMAKTINNLREEVNEQARLLGMSAERELRLLAKIEELERLLGISKAALNICVVLGFGTDCETYAKAALDTIDL